MIRPSNQSDPALSTFFLLMGIASLLIVPVMLGILVWAIGWGVLVVLSAAFVLFVLILMARHWFVDRRAER